MMKEKHGKVFQRAGGGCEPVNGPMCSTFGVSGDESEGTALYSSWRLACF